MGGLLVILRLGSHAGCINKALSPSLCLGFFLEKGCLTPMGGLECLQLLITLDSSAPTFGGFLACIPCPPLWLLQLVVAIVTSRLPSLSSHFGSSRRLVGFPSAFAYKWRSPGLPDPFLWGPVSVPSQPSRPLTQAGGGGQGRTSERGDSRRSRGPSATLESQTPCVHGF